MQCEALRHVLNNPLTIIQGGPGSGKTAFGAEHLSCLFQEIAVYTHVGRQAVSLCDRLGGCRENASTIHSAHHKRQKKSHEALLRVKYSERIEIVVIDEVEGVAGFSLHV
jgi:tRNA uridine 5-carbamoylmethylation protein Kti12